MSVGAVSTRLGMVLTVMIAASATFAHVSADRLRDLQELFALRLDAKPTKALRRAAQHVETAATATRHHRKVQALARAGRLVRSVSLSEAESNATSAAFSAFHDELVVARSALADRLELSERPARALRRMRRRLDAADRVLDRALAEDTDANGGDVPTKRRWRALTRASRVLRSESRELGAADVFGGIVGSEGGLAESGRFSLLVPAGALTGPTTFRATAVDPSDHPYAPPAGAIAAFELSPTGIELPEPAPFTLPLPSALEPGTELSLLAYEQHELTYVIHAGARVDADGLTATGHLRSTLGTPGADASSSKAATASAPVSRWIVTASTPCPDQTAFGPQDCHLYAWEADALAAHVHATGMEKLARNSGPHGSAIPSSERDSRLLDLRRDLASVTRRLQANVWEVSAHNGTTIHVKNEEENQHPASLDDDFFMTPTCAVRLLRLAELVEQRCGPAWHVRVTEAYDARGEHSANSLHYEGRALDLTLTRSGQPVKTCDSLVMLADLAAEAGFHYVLVERPSASAAHVHVSVRACEITTLHENQRAETLGFGGAGGMISEDCFNCDPAWRRVTFSDFTLPRESELVRVRWDGFYEQFTDELNPAAPSTVEWEVSVWSSKDMQPDELLATWTRGSDAVSRTALGVALSPAWNEPSVVPVYEFEMTLAPSFVAEPSRTYWLSVVAKTDAFTVPAGAEFATAFLWAPAGAAVDGSDGASVFDDENGERIEYGGRRAFALSGCE